MPILNVTSMAGTTTAIEAKGGISVMEVIRNAGFDELMAICGGSCSCATCHVYVDPAFADLLGLIGEDENELLEGSRQRRPESRLSCQIPFDDGLDGLKVTIVAE